MSDILSATKTSWTVRALSRDYTLSPLRFRSWGALIRFIRQSVISSAMDAAATSELSRVEKDAATGQATKIANMISLGHAMPGDPQRLLTARDEVQKSVENTEDSLPLDAALDQFQQAVLLQQLSNSDEAKMLGAVLTSPEGMLEIFWLSLQIHHKNVTRARAEEIALDMGQELSDVSNEIIRLSTEGPTPKKGQAGIGTKEKTTDDST